MTLNDIVARVREQIIDLPSEIEPLIAEWVYGAIRSAEDRHNFWYMEAEEQYTTQPDERALGAKPADWKEARRPPSVTLNDGGQSVIEWASSDTDMELRPGLRQDGRPFYLLQTADEVLVYPTSDGRSDWPDGEYRIRVPYWRRTELPAPLEQSHWLTANAPLYLIYYASYHALVFNRDEERAAGYVTLAEREFQRVRRLDKRSRLPDTLTLTPYTGALGPGRRVGRRRI